MRRTNPRYGCLYKLDPSPEDLIRLLRTHLSGRNLKLLPSGFHEANLRALKLEDILMLARAENGNLYIITPIDFKNGKKQNCRTCDDGVWKTKNSKNGVIVSNFKSRMDQGPKGTMREYALMDLKYAICVIKETKSNTSQSEEASVHPTNTGQVVNGSIQDTPASIFQNTESFPVHPTNTGSSVGDDEQRQQTSVVQEP